MNVCINGFGTSASLTDCTIREDSWFLTPIIFRLFTQSVNTCKFTNQKKTKEKKLMKKTVCILILILSLPLISMSLPKYIDQSTYETIIRSLSKTYRYGNITALLEISTKQGKRYYKSLIRRYGKQRYRMHLLSVGKRIIKASMDEIFIRKDGSVLLKYHYLLKYGRNLRKYRNSIRIIKIKGKFFLTKP